MDVCVEKKVKIAASFVKMTNKKYILHPGYVTSSTDGDEHYISASQLCALYNVSMKECIDSSKVRSSRMLPKGLIKLYPRYGGNYVVKEG